MFGLFKKKDAPQTAETAAPAPAAQRGGAYKEFAAAFLPEELDILAVTGPGGVSLNRREDSGLWHVAIGLSAWMDQYEKEIHPAEMRLEALVDTQLLDHLRARLRRDFIISATVRISEDGSRFLLTDLPKPAYDAGLMSILEQQKTPVTLQAEGLGTFTLSRAMNWFQTELNWAGTPVQLAFDQDEDQEDCLTAARVLISDSTALDEQLRQFAAQNLLDQANEWEADNEESEGPLSREELAARLEAESVQVCADGSFEVCYHDSKMFWIQGIRVSGSLSDGPIRAEADD